jgi:TonB family protein
MSDPMTVATSDHRSTRRTASLFGPVLVVLLLSACATRGPAPTPLGQRAHQANCSAGNPVELPVGLVLDAAGVLAWMEEDEAGRWSGPSPLLFTVRRPDPEPDGGPGWVRLLAGPGDDPWVDDLGRVILDHVHVDPPHPGQGQPDPPTRFRLRVDPRADGFDAFELHPTWGCPPRFLNASRLEIEMQRLGEEIPAGQRREVVVHIEVRLDGTPGEIRVGTASGDVIFDRRVVDLARIARFEPGLIDGIPVATWAQVPFTAHGAR